MYIINRPGVAGNASQTPLSLIHYMTQCNDPFPRNLPNIIKHKP